MGKLLFLLSVALVSLCAQDKPTPQTVPQTMLQIQVMNLNGKPVDNASVIVKFVEGRSKLKFGAKIHTEWDLKTSQEGMVKIPSIPQGKVSVQVIAKNYQTFGQIFDVEEAEKTIEVKLNPPQPQYTAHPKQ